MSAAPNLLSFPVQSEPDDDGMIVDKYRPRVIADFCGLVKPKEILSRLAENPKSSNWLFKGPPGTGKTTMAMALADAIPAELQHIASNELTVSRINEVWRRSFNMPIAGYKYWLNLLDEVDTGSKQALESLLSKLDASEKAPYTIWVLTCNDDANLPERLVQRCIPIDFSNYAIQSDAVELLADVWSREAPGKEGPNFARLIKEANGSVRKALCLLERELMLA